MDQPPWVISAIDAFVEERYDDCIEILVGQPELDFTCTQLLLISFLRSGQESLATSILNTVLLAYPAQSLEARLILFSAGRETLDLEQELSKAKSTIDLCRLHFYSGQLVQTLGLDEQLFRQAMTAAAQTRADCIEQIIAERVAGADRDDQDFAGLQQVTDLVNAADGMIDRGRVIEGIAQYKSALNMLLAQPEAPKPLIGILHYRIGVILSNLNRNDEARPYLESALPILEPIADARRETALTLSKLGICQQRAGEYESALATFRKSYEMWVDVVGEEDPESITALDDIAYNLELMGDLERAQGLVQKVLQLRVKVLGPAHKATLESYTNLGSLLERRGDLQNALPYREMEVKQRTDSFGLLQDFTLQAYADWFLLLLRLDSRDEAHALVQQIVTATEGASAEECRNAVYGLVRIADKCYELGEATFNVECMSAAVELGRRVFKPDDEEMIDLTGSLGEAYRTAGRLNDALRLNEECLALRRQRLGPEHEKVALSLNNLAQVHQDLGHLNQSLVLLEEALRIDRSNFGECHHAVAGDLNNIGNALSGLGEYARAKDYYRKAIDIWQTLHPEGFIYLGIALGNLGRIYLTLSDTVGAQRYLERALAMLKKVAGPHHPETQVVMASLIKIRNSRLDQKETKESILSAIKQNKVRLGSANRQSLSLQTMLARLNDDAASQLVDELLASTEDSALLPEVADLLNVKGRLLAKKKDFEGAEAMWERALENTESAQWDTTRFSANVYRNLAAVKALQGKLDAALEDMRRAVESFDTAWKNLSPSLTEVDREGLLKNAGDITACVSNLLVDYMPHSSKAAELALECTLRYKGLEATLLERERSYFRRDPRPEVREKFEAVRRLKERITDELMVNPGSRGALFNREQIIHWQMEYRAASEELAQLLDRTESDYNTGALREAVASRLTPDAGLLEILQFESRNFHDWSHEYSDPVLWVLNPPRYIAFLLRPGTGTTISWAMIGSVKELYVLTSDLLPYITEQLPPTNNSPQDSQPTSTSSSWKEAALVLRNEILDRVAGVWDCRRLFIAPDGILANVPFEVLPDVDGETLLERRRITYLSSGRDLLRSSDRPAAEQTEAIVVANPAFDLLDERRPVTVATLRAVDVALHSSSGHRHISHYQSLMGTAEEGNEIALKLGARLWVGAEANKSNLLSVRSPRVLHLATHGFSTEAPGIDQRLERIIDSLDVTQMTQMLMQPMELTKSGLVVAGANWKALLTQRFVDVALSMMNQEDVARISSELSTIDNPQVLELKQLKLIQKLTAPLIDKVIETAKSDHPSDFMDVATDPALNLFLPPEEAGSGLLTAEDAAWLDLSATDLVTLSACDTGLGINSFGGGLLGLRRSFLIAGARMLVCSLWKVPDLETATLMREFYDFALAGDDCDVALSKAKLKMQRAYPDQPYYWAAFVCYGNPGPLSRTPVTEAGKGQ